jgi:hypothetical protein
MISTGAPEELPGEEFDIMPHPGAMLVVHGVAQIGHPSGDSIEAVGLEIAESVVPDGEEEYVQRIVIVVAASEGDLGGGGDAISGLRLHIFLVDEDDNGTWTLHTAETTVMCDSHRGANPGGLCG